MKTSIATTLSVIGVIAAGAAAYAVNTSVLGAVAENPPVAVAQAPANSVTPAPIANVTNAAVQSQQNETIETTTTYKVGDAGSVVVDISTGRIVVTNILPAAGFTSEPARADANGVVKVHFVSSTQRIEFIAKLVNGAIITDVINETPSSMTPPREYDDDDDDDDDDHEDDHHEERDHDEDEEDHDEDEDDD